MVGWERKAKPALAVGTNALKMPRYSSGQGNAYCTCSMLAANMDTFVVNIFNYIKINKTY